MRHILPSALACLLCAAALSCSGDDSDGSEPVAGSSGGGGKGGAVAAGQGGSGGSVPPPMPVPCGSNMCTPPTNPLSALLGGMAIPGLPTGAALPMAVACCVDQSKGTCGTAATAGAACEPPAVPDTRCPGLDLGALGAAAGGLGGLGGASSGCCTPSNMCGLDGALFGRGCVENGEAKSMLGAIPFVGTLFNVPAPRACDAPPAGDDAGSPDAGM
ncbi:MAG TPA: hypothetical protein VJR89_06835 [Polyangiales bacterium]|nr:hypothetical protein [Polyangiales bacterium]